MLKADHSVELKKEQVLSTLEARYFHMIPSRFVSKPLDQQKKDRFSRALAAFVIQKFSDCNDVAAVASIVDCGDDNGIDAIYYDRRQNTLWLVQSKYGDAPDRGASQAFCTGINDLMHERYERFRLTSINPEFTRVQPDIEDAFAQLSTKVVACVVYLGNGLGIHAVSDFDQLKASQNELKNWFDWREIGLQVMHDWLTTEQTVQNINVEISIERWNYFTNPRRAVYGLISAHQLNSLYHTYGNALFQKNIRHFLGKQSVNLAISETVQAKPVEFFYLNNGITIICSHFDHSGNNTDRATFTLNNFSIVNGAQTVGSIGLAGQNGEISSNAKLMVTILEIGDDDHASELGTRITQARNMQTAINRDDFVALDPNQERLRQELAISDVIYNYRPSAESTPNDVNQFTFGEATRALACFFVENVPIKTQIIVVAKKEIGQVTDRNGPHYSKLFHNGITGVSLYRWVQIYRYIENDLFEPTERTEHGSRLMFFRHGRFFILHIWARRSQIMLNKAELVLSDDDKLIISEQILDLAEQIYSVAEAMFAADDKGYLKIFRSLADTEPLYQAVMRHLNQYDTA